MTASMMSIRQPGLVSVDGTASPGGTGEAGIWPGDDEFSINGTKYSTFAGAVAAAISGDTIYVGIGIYTCNSVSLPSGVNLIGIDRDDCVFQTSTSQECLKLAGSNYVYGITVQNTASNVSYIAAIDFDGNNIVCRNVKAIGSNSHASGFGYGFYQQAQTGVVLWDCVGDCTGTTSTSQYPYRKDTSANGTCKIIGGEYLGNAANNRCIYNDQTGLVELSLPRSNCTTTATGGGDFEGYYINVDNALGNAIAGLVDIPNLLTSTNNIYRGASLSDSDFVATIATLPGGAVLTYNAPSSGDEANLVPSSTSQLAKMVLHNTTQGDDALISDCNTGTNTITLTANVPGTWAVTDTITIRSQTNTSTVNGGNYFVDFELVSDVSDNISSLMVSLTFRDTGSAGEFVTLHPYEANAISKRINWYAQVGNVYNTAPVIIVPIISDRYCMAWTASGSGTVIIQIRLIGETVQ